MANSPEPISIRDNPLDFRAPPPSPVASGRRSCVTNDGVLTEFLETSLRVPDLVLPDKIFPKQKFIENPTKIDFEALVSGSKLDHDHYASKILDSIGRVGCFQLVNFGISSGLLRSVLDDAKGVFRVTPYRRDGVTRSPENRSGFEEVHGDDEAESGQEFVWSRDEGLRLEMEKLWPIGYSNFSDSMSMIQSNIEKVAGKILSVLHDNFAGKSTITKDFAGGSDNVGTVCCIHRHMPNIPADQFTNFLRYDVIKMMIRVNEYSHALCFHIFDGATEFHVYSKKGWVSFCPEKDSIVVTVGDQFQTLSEGKYKHVVGRAVYKDEAEDHQISMAFLYSLPHHRPDQVDHSSLHDDGGGDYIISIRQQVVAALVFTALYQLIFYIYKNF